MQRLELRTEKDYLKETAEIRYDNILLICKLEEVENKASKLKEELKEFRGIEKRCEDKIKFVAKALVKFDVHMEQVREKLKLQLIEEYDEDG